MKPELILLLGAAAVIVPLAVLAAIVIFTEWKPPPRQSLAIIPAPAGRQADGLFELLTWNIGYAGLDRGSDFFLDGGTNSRATSRQAVEENLERIIERLRAAAPDVMFLQEVDRRADRSCHLPEEQMLFEAFPEYHRSFAVNYQVAFVPVPPARLMGGAVSGMAVLTRFAPAEALRLALPGRRPWPERIFHPKRCLVSCRVPLPDGRNLRLLNLHLSAFDRGGVMRRQQLEFIRSLILESHGRGDLIMAGGDWNCSLPGTRASVSGPVHDDLSWLIDLPADWTPAGWTWAVDPGQPTVRTLGAPLNARTTCYATIDGFLLSPGLELVEVRTENLGFENTDHHPVIARVRIA